VICLFHKKEYKGIYYDTKDRNIILYSVAKCKKCGKIWKEEINKTQYKNAELLKKDLIIVRKTHEHIEVIR
jgi:hypothetical protein